MAAAFGADVADDLLAEAAPALDWAKTFIEHEKIQCDFEVTGRVQLAYTRSQFDGQKRLADKVREKSRVEVELVERSDLGREIDTGLYHGGLLFPQHGALHPAKYHRGMLEAVRRRGVPVVSHARVEAMTREGTRLVAQTAKGPIRSEKVVLATNGYTTRPFQWHLRRVFPLPSFIIATEELPENLIGHLAPGRRMMVETRARHSYFRISPDGKRVLFGGRAAMRDVPLHIAAQRQRQTMVEVWPELAEAKLSHVWSGYTGFSFAQMPHVGQHDSVCFAMGFSGSGTVMAPYLGAKAGWLAVGDARAETAYARTRLPRHVLHPFDRPHFLKAADLVFRHWVDRAEAWQARRS